MFSHPWTVVENKWRMIPVTVQGFIDPSGYTFPEGYQGNLASLLFEMVVNVLDSEDDGRSLVKPVKKVTVHPHFNPEGFGSVGNKIPGWAALDDIRWSVTRL